MSIQKMNSQDFNNIMTETQNKILEMNNNIDSIKSDMQTKLLVMNYEVDYLNSSLNKLSNSSVQDSSYILLDGNKHGLYSTYCNNVLPYLRKDPVNVFNVKPINSEDIYFKDEAIVTINGIQLDDYKNIIKEDTVKSKKIYFEEFVFDSFVKQDDSKTSYIDNNNTITISVSIDQQKAYGINKFNMIEIDPFLMGSFDIKTINVYDSNGTTVLKTISNISNAGKTRIILDKKYLFKKVDLVVVPKYSIIKNEVQTYPFGLKHLYFYEVDFRNDSYIDIEYDSDNFIDYVNNKVDLYTPLGIQSSTLTEQGIKIYLDNVNGVLGTELEPTDNIRKTIARNIKKIYFRVPLGQDQATISANSSIYAIRFYAENR
jgi:hypothetical protein